MILIHITSSSRSREEQEIWKVKGLKADRAVASVEGNKLKAELKIEFTGLFNTALFRYVTYKLLFEYFILTFDIKVKLICFKYFVNCIA